jgi:hypothetical protein
MFLVVYPGIYLKFNTAVTDKEKIKSGRRENTSEQFNRALQEKIKRFHAQYYFIEHSYTHNLLPAI